MESKTEDVRKGKPKGLPKTGGRQIGSPNKVTSEVKQAIAAFTSNNSEKLDKWLNEVDDPAKRLDLYFKALEYTMPKLARTEVSGDADAPVKHIHEHKFLD
tara:strand:- start:1644 stop:1946 length:303 start_codon:yes stop_codon:yes gene_type:complete